ncbi:hypothetical protein MMPV_007341 [Pyropia vietnamensis]
MEGDTVRRPGDVEGTGASVSGGPGCETCNLNLLDLPDDVLRLVVGCITGCVGGLRRGDHVPLLLTCRRLAAIGYRSVKEVHISSRTLSCVEANRQGDLMPDGHVSAVALLTSPAGERLQTRLFSLRDFLRYRAPNIGRVVLSDELAGGAVTPHGLLAQQVFWGLLRGTLAPLPVSSLVCDHSAVAALVNQQVSSVALRCLWLGGLDARSPSGGADLSLDLLHTLRGRRLVRLTLERLTGSSPAHGPTSSDSVIGLQHVAALKSCASLPVTLDLGRLGCWTQELLLRLCDDTNEVASLRELTICVAELRTATLDPLVRLSGLTHLTLDVQKRATEEAVPPGCSL